MAVEATKRKKRSGASLSNRLAPRDDWGIAAARAPQHSHVAIRIASDIAPIGCPLPPLSGEQSAVTHDTRDTRTATVRDGEPWAPATGQGPRLFAKSLRH